MNNIRVKIKKGFLWAGFGAFAGRGLQFISDIILSRLLFPEDFGLMAIGLSVLNISEMLTETGFSSALIQKQGDIKKYLNTTWTMEVIKSIILFLFVFLIAKPISIFYDEPSVLGVLRGISFLFLLRGFRNVGVVFFRKNLEIHKQVILDIIPSIFQLLLVIPMAYYLQSVWAIILSVYVRRFTELVLSFLMHTHKPRFEFHTDNFKELIHFGKWIIGLSIIGAVRKNFVPLFIGKYFDIETLGYFNRAELLSILFFSVLTEIVWKVGYPVMSQFQYDYKRLKKFYLDLFFTIIYLGIPISICIIIFSEDIVLNIFSVKWLASVFMLKILVLAGLISFTGTLSSMAMQAIGKPKVSAKISLYSIILLLITIFPFSNYGGIVGLIISLIISRFYSVIHSLLMVMKFIGIKKIDILRPIKFSLFNSIVFIIPIITLKLYLFNNINMLTLIFFIIYGTIIFILLAIFWNKVFTFNLINTLSPLFNKQQNIRLHTKSRVELKNE